MGRDKANYAQPPLFAELETEKCFRQAVLHNYIIAEVNFSISRVEIGETNFV